MEARWRSFPLEQINSQEEGYAFWEQSLDATRSLRAFLALEAARDQGENLFRELLFGLLKAIHEEKKPVHEMGTIRDVASQVAGLDVERMTSDMEDPGLRERIARDYREGTEQHGVFGTPTFLLAGGEAVFVKTAPPPPEQAVTLLTALRSLSESMPYTRELKKPRPPQRDT